MRTECRCISHFRQRAVHSLSIEVLRAPYLFLFIFFFCSKRKALKPRLVTYVYPQAKPKIYNLVPPSRHAAPKGRLLLRPTRHAYANHEYHILHFARFANAFLLSLLRFFSTLPISPLGRVEISAGARWIKNHKNRKNLASKGEWISSGSKRDHLIMWQKKPAISYPSS